MWDEIGYVKTSENVLVLRSQLPLFVYGKCRGLRRHTHIMINLCCGVRPNSRSRSLEERVGNFTIKHYQHV